MAEGALGPFGHRIAPGTLRRPQNGVLHKLKHIFPNTYQRIKSIRSPAKVGLVVIDLTTSPVVSWRGWETPPPPPAPWLSCHSLHDLERRSAGWEAGHHIYSLVSIRKNVF